MRLLGCLAVGGLLFVSSCSSSPAPNRPPAGATSVAGGCGATPLYRGARPAWTAGANGPADLVQAMGRHGDVVGFLFGYPLRAGHPDDRANKILWVVREPRNGSELDVSGHPLGQAAPVVEQRQSADSSPGEIYPSIVDVPSPGCWAFTLRWNGHEDTIELPYR